MTNRARKVDDDGPETGKKNVVWITTFLSIAGFIYSSGHFLLLYFCDALAIRLRLIKVLCKILQFLFVDTFYEIKYL